MKIVQQPIDEYNADRAREKAENMRRREQNDVDPNAQQKQHNEHVIVWCRRNLGVVISAFVKSAGPGETVGFLDAWRPYLIASCQINGERWGSAVYLSGGRHEMPPKKIDMWKTG